MKRILIVILALLVLSALGVATFAMITDSDQESSGDKAQIEESSSKILSFKSYQEELSEFKLNNESLAVLSLKFDKIIAENEKIVIEKNHFVNVFLDERNDIDYNEKSEQIELSTDTDVDTLQYLMLLSYLTTGNKESVMWIGSDYDVVKSNRMPPRNLFVSYDYEMYGYENALEYHNAIKNGEAEFGENSYYVNFHSKKIYKCTDKEKVNLWESLKKE